MEGLVVVRDYLAVGMGMAEVGGEGEGREILLEDLVDDGETVPIGVFQFEEVGLGEKGLTEVVGGEVPELLIEEFPEPLGQEVLILNLVGTFQEVLVDEVHQGQAVAMVGADQSQIAHGHGPGDIVVFVAEIDTTGYRGHQVCGEFLGGPGGEEVGIDTTDRLSEVGE